MRLRCLSIAVLCAICGAPLAAEKSTRMGPKARSTCFVAEGATQRKQQVESDMLPNVVFAGEAQPASVETYMARHQVPAFSVAAIHQGKLDWTAAWGELEVGGARADCGTLFQAGSLAKPVTLLAAVRMKQKGLIDFDRNIETYLTSYRLPAGRQTDANPVTFRNLFTHTSGITPGGYEGYAQGTPIPSDQQIARAEPPANSRKVEVLTEPGSSLDYSGGGYTVAEIALQDHFHKPFEAIMRQWLLDPIRMRSADFTQPPPASHRRISAHGYNADGSAVPGGWRVHPEQAAAGLWASAGDMAAFMIEIGKGYNGKSKVFSQASIRELLANPIDGHAYGFRVTGEGDSLFITHYGGTVGYRAGMTLNPVTGDGAAFLTNSDNGADLEREFLGAMARAYHWPVFREAQVTRTTQSVDALKSLTGRYAFAQSGSKVSVVHENQALTLVFPNGDRYAMVPIEGKPQEFIHPATAVRASFDRDGEQQQIQLYGETGRREGAAETSTRTKVAVEPGILSQYVGRYELAPGMLFDVQLSGDHLAVQLGDQPRFPVFPESESKFFFEIVDAQITFVKNESGKVMALVLHQGGRDQEAKRVEP